MAKVEQETVTTIILDNEETKLFKLFLGQISFTEIQKILSNDKQQAIEVRDLISSLCVRL